MTSLYNASLLVYDITGSIVEIHEHGWLLLKLQSVRESFTGVDSISNLNPELYSRYFKSKICFVATSYFPLRNGNNFCQIGTVLSLFQVGMITLWDCIYGFSCLPRSKLEILQNGIAKIDSKAHEILIPKQFLNMSSCFVVWWAFMYKSLQNCLYNEFSGNVKTKKIIKDIIDILCHYKVSIEVEDGVVRKLSVFECLYISNFSYYNLFSEKIPEEARQIDSEMFVLTRNYWDQDILNCVCPRVFSCSEVKKLIKNANLSSGVIRRSGHRSRDSDFNMRESGIPCVSTLSHVVHAQEKKDCYSDNGYGLPAFPIVLCGGVSDLVQFAGNTDLNRNICNGVFLFRIKNEVGDSFTVCVHCVSINIPNESWRVLVWLTCNAVELCCIIRNPFLQWTYNEQKDGNTTNSIVHALLENVQFVPVVQSEWRVIFASPVPPLTCTTLNDVILGDSVRCTMNDPASNMLVLPPYSVRELSMFEFEDPNGSVFISELRAVVSRIESGIENDRKLKYKIILNECVLENDVFSALPDAITVYIDVTKWGNIDQGIGSKIDSLMCGFVVSLHNFEAFIAKSLKYVYIKNDVHLNSWIDIIGILSYEELPLYHSIVTMENMTESQFSALGSVFTRKSKSTLEMYEAPYSTVEYLVQTRNFNRCVWTVIGRITTIKRVHICIICSTCLSRVVAVDTTSTHFGGCYGRDDGVAYYCSKCVSYSIRNEEFETRKNLSMQWVAVIAVDDNTSECHIRIEGKDAILNCLGLASRTSVDLSSCNPFQDNNFDVNSTANPTNSSVRDPYGLLVQLMEDEVWTTGFFCYEPSKVFKSIREKTSLSRLEPEPEYSGFASSAQGLLESLEEPSYLPSGELQKLPQWDGLVLAYAENAGLSRLTQVAKGLEISVASVALHRYLQFEVSDGSKNFSIIGERARFCVKLINGAIGKNQGVKCFEEDMQSDELTRPVKLQRVNHVDNPYSVEFIDAPTLCDKQLLLFCVGVAPLENYGNMSNDQSILLSEFSYRSIKDLK